MTTSWIITLADKSQGPDNAEYVIQSGRKYTVGRESCDLTVKDEAVSRSHAFFEVRSNALAVTDTSRYGTFVNERMVSNGNSMNLQDGDKIKIGDSCTLTVINEASKENDRRGRNVNRNDKGGRGDRGGRSNDRDRGRDDRGRDDRRDDRPPPRGAAPRGAKPACDDEDDAPFKLETPSADAVALQKRIEVAESEFARLRSENALLLRRVQSLQEADKDNVISKDNAYMRALLIKLEQHLNEANASSASTTVEGILKMMADGPSEDLMCQYCTSLLELKVAGTPNFDRRFAMEGAEVVLTACKSNLDKTNALIALTDVLASVSGSVKCLQMIRAWPGLEELLDTLMNAGHEGVQNNIALVKERVSAAPRDEMQEYLEKELQNIIGLKQVKRQLKIMLKSLRLDAKRREAGIAVSTSSSYHMVLLGNPGTGKTTVARLIAKLLFKIGVIKRNVLVECSREDLVAGYIGQTAIQTKKVIDSARGGVCFIDEAYRLSSGGEKDFGKEAIETVMTEMTKENSPEDAVVFLFAGYRKEMDKFKNANPGMARRMTYSFLFEDYSVEELCKIVALSVANKNFKLADGVEDDLPSIIGETFTAEQRGQHNGGLAVRVVDSAIESLNIRLDIDSGTLDKLVTLTVADFQNGSQKVKEQWWQ